MYKLMISRPQQGLEFIDAKTLTVFLPMDSGFNKKKNGIFQIKMKDRTIVAQKDDKVTVDGVPVEAIYGFLSQDTEIVTGLKTQISELELRVAELNKTCDEFREMNKLKEVKDGD